MVEFEDRKRSEKILGGRTTKIGVAREFRGRETTKSGTKCAAEGQSGRGGFRGKETTKSGAGGAAEGGPKWLRSKPWREDHEEHRRKQGAEPRERGKVSNKAVHLGVNEMVPTSLSSSGRTKAAEMCEDFTKLDQVVSELDPRQSQGNHKQSRSVVASIANKVHEALKPFSG
ncbi:hypothetical protein TcasGA2_TC004201 [Tribolium castaneum]|uniref:Uncharacterized protein n=1 Tax=Tribolium castaneum TaxID=7070 RepID=D7EJ37_TRICA|nr:hypothetical protein TcasGA2_TC004201 [Tribolium castaneum]